ncbi:MAG: 6,7-dimethyl-8-ribityllumazine synthase [Caulobacterales bacterium]
MAIPKIEGARLLFVVAPYYPEITDQLLTGAHAVAAEAGAKVDVIEVPGAFEIPQAIAMYGNRYEGYVALGCVVRGETSHYDYVCGESARALMDLGMNRQIQVGYGILTVENLAQAQERAAPNGRDKGGEATRACVTLVALKRKLTNVAR